MSVVMYSCISEQSELTSQQLYTHVSQSSQNLQVSRYVLMYLRAFRTYKSLVMFSCISEQSELTSQQLYSCISEESELTSVVMHRYTPGVRTYKSVVMHSCISEQSELTILQLCTHASLSIQNLQVSSYVLMYLRAFITCNDFPTCQQF